MENIPDNLPKRLTRSLIEIAQALAGMGARAVTVNSETRTSPASSSEFCNEVIRKS
jgi:hypothetical protein